MRRKERGDERRRGGGEKEGKERDVGKHNMKYKRKINEIERY